MNKKIRMISLYFMIFLFGFIGCGTKNQQAPLEETAENTETYENLADSIDEAIIVSLNTEEKQLQCYNYDIGRTYTLSYNGATRFQNKFGDEIVPEQMSGGDFVNITFIKDQKLAKKVQISTEYTMTPNVTVFDLNAAARTMQVNNEAYEFHKNCVFLSNGKLMEPEDLNAVDTLKVVALDHVIYGVTVEKGHGYARLIGHESFVDGFIEVGQNIIQKISDEMLLVVPEGHYTVVVSKSGVQGIKELEITKGQETVLDLTDLQTEQIRKVGKVLFSITPADAKLYIDHKEIDASKEVELDCGVHQMTVKASGYKTLSQYIKVGTETANINIELDLSTNESEDEEEDESTDVSSNTVTTETVTGASDYRVYIDAPASAELYVDGTYIGIIPTNFAKVEGAHTVSVRKTGYQTRSYSLQIDNENKNVSYSFSALEELTTE